MASASGAAAQLGESVPRRDLQQIDKTKGLTPKQTHSKLEGLRQTGPAVYWRSLDAIMVDAPDAAPSYKRAKVQCEECKSVLEATNPANLGASHFTSTGRCKKALDKADGGANAKR